MLVHKLYGERLQIKMAFSSGLQSPTLSPAVYNVALNMDG